MNNVKISNPVHQIEATDTFDLDGNVVTVTARGNVNVSKSTFSIGVRVTTKSAPYDLDSREIAISSVAACVEAAVGEAWRMIEAANNQGPNLFSQPQAAPSE